MTYTHTPAKIIFPTAKIIFPQKILRTKNVEQFLLKKKNLKKKLKKIFVEKKISQKNFKKKSKKK